MKKTGVLLINLGTPDATDETSVRHYLKEFLSDPRVIDTPAVVRWLLLHCVILPFRPKQSALAYRKIWLPEGSPLLLHTQHLSEKVQEKLGDAYTVRFAMRYGKPGIADVVRGLLKENVIERLVLVPLYPQYASASTGSSVEAVLTALSQHVNIPPVSVLEPFFDDAGFIDCLATRGRTEMEKENPDHTLFSFHGLPEHQIRKAECVPGYCLKKDDRCCAEVNEKNLYCYRAQCFATARLIAERLGLAKESYTIAFQSRLGRIPWIKPYTDKTLKKLAKEGKRRLLVFCPAFAADCLETLEEIAIRGKDTFLAAGGERLTLVPSLNAGDDWAGALSRRITRGAAKQFSHSSF